MSFNSLKIKLGLATLSFFISFSYFLSALFGYLFTRFLAGKETGKPGKIKSIIIEFRNWKIHLHHWFIAFCFLILNFFLQLFPMNSIFLGFLSGVIYQGLTYPDWHRIVIRKNKTSEVPLDDI